MTATIIDGKAHAEALRSKVAAGVADVKARYGFTPGLAVVLVGDDPASEVYVRNKKKMTLEVGMQSFDYHLPASASREAILAKVQELNANAEVDGILVQLPLPTKADEEVVINAIDPAKDVDGFHVINTGKLATGQAGLVPCTPLGCLMLLKETLGDLSGKHAVVIGRSNIVGKPMAALLLNENCTVTLAHSRTRDIEGLTRMADIVVAAVGRPRMVKARWIHDGATVIDVGINRAEGKLVGDVDFDKVKDVAGAITPVPGGVGPMTIACLLHNTLKAACERRGVGFVI